MHHVGLVVTRFPETRQEGEKQNKPERAVKPCGLHWKGKQFFIISLTQTRKSSNEQNERMGVLKVSKDSFWCV